MQLHPTFEQIAKVMKETIFKKKWVKQARYSSRSPGTENRGQIYTHRHRKVSIVSGSQTKNINPQSGTNLAAYFVVLPSMYFSFTEICFLINVSTAKYHISN